MTRNERLAAWRENNREKLREYQREYMRKRRAANPEKSKAQGREDAARRRAADIEKQRKYDREYYKKRMDEQHEKMLARAAEQREKHRNRIRQIARNWAARNKDKKSAAVAVRRAVVLNAMPVWVDRQQIRSVYEECRKTTMRTGIKHHVDHIVPLRGKVVSGLHVPWNLQVIPALQNARKSNKWGP